jgi:hypothetical protein
MTPPVAKTADGSAAAWLGVAVGLKQALLG